MVKFSNGRKGRPSERTSFKVKYKIERKVKQHRKRVKKQAKKLKGRGLKHKSTHQQMKDNQKASSYPTCFPLSINSLKKQRDSNLLNRKLKPTPSMRLSMGSSTLRINLFIFQNPKNFLSKNTQATFKRHSQQLKSFCRCLMLETH